MSILRFSLFTILLISCSQYRAFQKVSKSTDPDFQYEKAVYYFNNGEYNRSLELLENLLTIYKGTEKSEDIYYYYVYNNFYLKDYISTIFHADNFISNFVSSSRNEEIAFLSAFSHYIDTPRYSLDQKKTTNAIDALQNFIQSYPKSDSIKVATDYIISLNKRLQKKHFENAKQYFSTGKYKAAIHAIDYFLEDYPETDLREEISFIQVKSYFELGKNSIDEKKLQRIKEAIFACNNFLLAFVDGPYNKEVIEINKKLKDIENGL
ncbi:MAG: outer membrane protein assembly factor BamD [Bacteroidota bacterium]|nr:outer membrane protein assembly factor BamD [Bacteroidota bacterium]